MAETLASCKARVSQTRQKINRAIRGSNPTPTEETVLITERERLATLARELTGKILDANKAKFEALAVKLKGHADKAEETVENLNKLSKTLENLAKLVGVITRIISLKA